MHILKITSDLVKIKSEVGQINKLNECIEYCKNLFSDKKVYTKDAVKNNLPSCLISNTNTLDFDVLVVGHIDVIPATDNMFEPKIEKDIMYARGCMDMKAFVVVGLATLEKVLKENIDIKYGVLIVSDEETGGFDGAKYWTEELGLKTKVLLDPDGGKKIDTIVQKAKGVLHIKIKSEGLEAHGSRPWLGYDANENAFQVISNIRKKIPHYDNKNIPADKWIPTMHVGTIKGGKATNSIASYCEANLDIRLNENLTREQALDIVEKSLIDGVKFEIVVEGNSCYTDLGNKYLIAYSDSIKKEINKDVKYIFSEGASDGRYFSNGETVIITHQATGDNIHEDGEWLDLNTLKQMENIYIDFIRRFKELK